VHDRPRILGIDPALTTTGYGIISIKDETYRLHAAGEIKTSPSSDLPVRLHKIYTELGRVIDDQRPSLAVLEEGFYSKNVKVALGLGQARGAAMVACAERGIEVALYSVREIKLAVAGRGSASKEQVAYMVGMLLGVDTDKLGSLDVTDALSAAICASQKMDLENVRIR